VAELIIRETTSADLQDILYVEHEAFHSDKEPQFTKDMLVDASAQPCLSLMAYIDNQPAGHILFTHAYLAGNRKVEVSFLTPLFLGGLFVALPTYPLPYIKNLKGDYLPQSEDPLPPYLSISSTLRKSALTKIIRGS
jgi:hypothetical protein